MANPAAFWLQRLAPAPAHRQTWLRTRPPSEETISSCIAKKMIIMTVVECSTMRLAQLPGTNPKRAMETEISHDQLHRH